MSSMGRREFVALLGGAAAWPLAARAQQPAMPVIGFLGSESQDGYAERLRGYSQGLKAAGYIEGEASGSQYRAPRLLVHIGDPSSNQAALESKLMVQ
jgi:putative ABC transport system substrate-binding protein